MLDVVDENNVQGSPTVHIQNYLHTEQDSKRTRRIDREESTVRNDIAKQLNILGLYVPE